MAQTTDPGSRTRGGAASGNGAKGSGGANGTNGTNGTNGSNGSATSGARRGFNLSALSGFFGPRPAGGANGANGQQRPTTGMGGFLKGWLLLVVGMYVLQIVLYLVDANVFHLWLTTHYVAGTNGGTKPGSLLILGGTSWYLLIFIALFAGLYYALVKFKILPRDLFGSRGQAQTNARAARDARDSSRGPGAGAAPNPPPLPSGVNPYADRTRAARREAQRRQAAAAVAAPQPKRGLFGRAKPAATSPAPTTTANGKTSAREPVQTASARPSDTHYQRVRAEQRQRKRRAAKR